MKNKNKNVKKKISRLSVAQAIPYGRPGVAKPPPRHLGVVSTIPKWPWGGLGQRQAVHKG
jgi:hypothetical protein